MTALTEFKDGVYAIQPASNPTVAHIIRSVDTAVPILLAQSETVVNTQSCTSSECFREMAALQGENECLREQLGLQIQDLQKENSTLKEQLQFLQRSTTSCRNSQILDGAHSTEVQIEAHGSQTCELTSEQVKVFNAIPDSLATFYQQMEHGEKELQPFLQLPEVYRKSSRTKGAYSKRNAVWKFMKDHPGGFEKCVNEFVGFSPLQLYEQRIKRSRTQKNAT